MKSKILTIISACVLSLSTVQAQSQVDSVDYFDQSLENLRDFQVQVNTNVSAKVVSATKSELKIQKAPSTIRVFTKEDIVKHNFQTVRDVLDRVPGFEVQEYKAGHQLTWVRGVQSRYNNKVLLLIDGVPMRDSHYGNFTVDEMIPIQLIERIEIINGPGSVLYGANSFSGVISITTKSEGKSVELNYGSFNTLSGNAQFSAGGFFGNVHYYDSDGFSPDLNYDGDVRKHDQTTTSKSINLGYRKKGFEALFGYTNYNYPYRYRESRRDYFFERTPLYGKLSYDFSVGEKSNLKAKTFINHYDFNIHKVRFYTSTEDTIRRVETEFYNTSMVGGELEFSSTLKDHQIIAGVSYLTDMARDIRDERTVDDRLPVFRVSSIVEGDSSFSRNDMGIYIQDVWSINRKLRFTGGLRYNILSNFDDQFNFRVGLTNQFTKTWYGKLLFGTAYRVPVYREYLEEDTYNPGLQPEKLQTTELQVGYVGDNFDVNLTLYHNLYDNFIQDVFVDSVQLDDGSFREVDDEMAFNFEERNITGVEVFANIRPTDRLDIIGGLSYKFSATETKGNIDASFPVFTSREVVEDKTDILFMSRLSGNLALTYRLHDKFRLGLTSNYFSGRDVPEEYQADVPEEVQNPSLADGFIRLNLNGNLQIIDNLNINFSINNALDTQDYSPPYGSPDDYDAQWPGRNFRVGLRYTMK